MDAGGGYTGRMGLYPVINLTLKTAKQESFEAAYYAIQSEIVAEFDRHRDILERGEERITAKEYEQYSCIADEKADKSLLQGSLKLF